MTSIEILLPDQLAEEARRAGLLSQERLENWIRRELGRLSSKEFFAALDRAAAVPDPAPMSPEDVAVEIAAMRAERRAREGR